MRAGVRARVVLGHAGELADAFSASDFREIDCLRGYMSGRTLANAEIRAERLATGADRVLVASGAINEESYLQSLSAATGIAFEPLNGLPRSQCPLDDARLIDAARHGLLPIVTESGSLAMVVSPRGVAARRMVAMIADDPSAAAQFRFTTAERFNHFLMRCAGRTLATQASDRLKQQWPALSAASPRRSGPAVAWLPLVLAAAIVFAAPRAAVHVIEFILASVFIAWLSLRLAGALVRRPVLPHAPPVPDRELPVYSIIAALYQEASSVDGLLRSIEQLDYPREKIDVILAIETDDIETRAAIAARSHRVPVTVIAVPAIGPRTKPKALNVALPFARGSFTVVYDAEDRPEPDQLRCSLRAFQDGGDELACVQARLCIDNSGDSWLARMFTAEYAAQFDVFLPGLTQMRLPLPLGGSSNHFRAGILRRIGGWDAYNVTEDADLGMRLARFGYRADIIDSTTYEEAPAHIGPWLRQRTRWFKGWMQTWLVHMREPVLLLRDLGLPGFAAFQLMVGGSALSALVHPLFMAWLIYALASGGEILHGDTLTLAVLGALYGTTAIIGYATSAALGWTGLKRRGMTSHGWVLLLTPFYWLLLSLAAWRALWQLFVAPYAWEKTAHGLAKTSQRAARLSQALLTLQDELELAKQSGVLPVIRDVPQYLKERQRARQRA